MKSSSISIKTFGKEELINMDILQYESKIWATADSLRGCGIKESEWPSFMMPFFALIMVESRLIRMFEGLKDEIGEAAFAAINTDDLYDMIKDQGQGYNIYIFEKNQTLKDICKNDKSFEIDFGAYLGGFDGETKDLLGVDAVEGEKFLDIKGVVAKLKAKKVLMGFTKLWSEIDLKPFNNSEITTFEEHIKRKWADISAETAGEQYTPDDVIALIAEIIASKTEEKGIVSSRLRLYPRDFFQIQTALPEYATQKAIVHYLDVKTAQIDRKIDLLTQKATKYGELKQSLINETVTHGLDKTVAMKDSGAEWIGEVPEHWKKKRIKDSTAKTPGLQQ
jgi:hypothetical protein